MRILDRYILKSFLVNYLLALCVLVGIFILMDVIVNMSDFAKGASAVEPQAEKLVIIGTAQPGETKSESSFNYQAGEPTQPLLSNGHSGRRAVTWFSFDLPVDETRSMVLAVTYGNEESARRTFDILVNGTKVGSRTIERRSPSDAAKFTEVQYGIPADLVRGRKLATVRFQATGGNEVAGVYGIRTVAVVGPSAWDIAGDMADYYFYQLPVIYQQVAGIIPLLAAGFTMIRMTRHHELTAMMASGVSLYRVAAPIILISTFFTALHIVNQEFIISQPGVIDKLVRKHNEVNLATVKYTPLRFIKDSDGSFLSALQYWPTRSYRRGVSIQAPNTIVRSGGNFIKDDGLRPGYVVSVAGFENAANKGDFVVTAVSENEIQVKDAKFVSETGRDGAVLSIPASMNDVCLVQRDESGTPIRHTIADSAQWLADPDPNVAHNAWILRDGSTKDDLGNQEEASRFGIYVRRTELDPTQVDLILSKKAIDFLSSSKVHELAKFSPDVSRPLLYKIMHLRFTQPFMNIVMLLIGIPFLLTREPNRLVANMFYCTAVSGFIFVATFVLFQLGGNQINPLWAAWLPVLIFGPFSLVMLDTIRT